MLKNYIKIALRNLMRQKFFSAVTILGLAVGFTCFILIFIYVKNEFSYDKFHKDHERIYRVVQTINEENGSRQSAVIAPRIGPWAMESLPEIEEMTRVIVIGRMTIGNDITKRDYERIWIADTNFFQFFDFELMKGDPSNVISQPNGILLTEKLAYKYFGRIPDLGEDLYTNVYSPVVSGVVKNIRKDSHLDFDVMIPDAVAAANFDWWTDYRNTNWNSNDFITYFKVAEGADIKNIEEQITKAVIGNYGPDDNPNTSFRLQPLTDIHFYSEGIEGGVNVGGSKPYYSYLLLTIGSIILIVACFNYMNLSTTAAIRRTREVGLRKTVGASKFQLTWQFLSEAILLSLIALIISILFVDLLIPSLNNFMEKDLSFTLLNGEMILGLISLAILTGLFSGIYPAIITARVSPAAALKSNSQGGRQRFTLRKTLVVSQFAVAIAMISSTVVIYQQLNYIQSKNLGFEVDNLVTIDINSGILRSNFESIKNDIIAVSGVSSVTVSSRVPGEWKDFPVARARVFGTDEYKENIFIGADQDFLKTYNIELIEGRNFGHSLSDTLSVLINEAAVAALNLENPIGADIYIDNINWGGGLERLEVPFKARVIGVTEDFTFESFRNNLRPMIIGYWNNPIQRIDYFTVRLSGANHQEVLKELRAVNDRHDAANPAEFHFLDQQFERFYREDKQRGQLFLSFSIIVVLLSCTGLFALASYITKSRTKEVGIRKVLGAKTSEITVLLVKDFAVLIGIAFILAIPAGYFTIDGWLDDFVYKVGITWWIFAVAGIAVLVIALLTISIITVKAASSNPVDTLKSNE